jgi:hypothetical protein
VVWVRTVLVAWRESPHERETAFRIDRYMAAGMGAIDLVLLPVVVPMGVPDRPLFLAEVFLVTSRVLMAISLFFSFVKQQFGLTSYGSIHSTVISLALTSGVGALTATFWRRSRSVGIYFLVLSVVAILVCTVYFGLVQYFVIVEAGRLCYAK